MEQMNNFVCEACNIQMHKNCYESHVNGKKHILKQEQFDKVHKSIFVSGVNKFTPENLKRIFRKYGDVSHVIKPKNNNVFAFIQFTDKSSVEKALKDRLFINGTRFFTQKFTNNKNDQSKSGNISADTSSNTSQNELTGGQVVGVSDFLVKLADPNECPNGQSVFEWQVHQFISQVELPIDMYHSLNDVMNDLEELFNTVLPGCRVIVFGSCGTSLAFKNSDVDLFLQCVGDQPEDFVTKEAKVMYRSRKLKIIARIPAARVPIVKFMHLASGWHCDITAKSRLGVSNSRLIRFLMSLDPRIRTLVMVIKFWAKVCDVTGSHQKMTTYSLVMLVIFYLQQLNPPILPSVVLLQQLAKQKEFSLGWECSFCDEEWTLRSASTAEENNSSLKELLSGFFQFYHTFDYNNVICPLLGHTIPVSDFENLENLPCEMHLYKENLKNDPKMKFRTNVMLRMQDPFELCLNITRNVIDKIFIVFKAACKVSYDLCQKSNEDCLLKSLFTIKKGMLDIPDDIISKFRIYFKKPLVEDTASSLGINEEEIYELITEAVLLFMKGICKLHVEPTNFETSSKIKKLVLSKDVHTSSDNMKGCEGSIYVCNAQAVVWDSRKKTHKVCTLLTSSLNNFEKELFISDFLYKPREGNIFSFNLSISSFEQFKHHGNAVELIMKSNDSEVKGRFKQFLEFVKYNITNLVHLAFLYIINAKISSPEIEVKELLKKLFDLKQESFAILIASNKGTLKLHNEECPVSKKEKTDQLSKHQRSLMQNLSNKIRLINTFENQAESFVCDIKASSKSDNENQMIRSDLLPCVLSTENPFLASIEKAALKPVTSCVSTGEKTNKGIYHEVQTKKEPENKSLELCDGMKGQEKETITFTSHERSSNNSIHEVDVKPNYNSSQQQPKVYLEHPHKFRKPSNHKFAHYNFLAKNKNSGGEYSRSREMHPYRQQMYPRKNLTGQTSNDYQYYGELVDNTRGNYSNKRYRYQKFSCISTDRQNVWYPTRFKK